MPISALKYISGVDLNFILNTPPVLYNLFADLCFSAAHHEHGRQIHDLFFYSKI